MDVIVVPENISFFKSANSDTSRKKEEGLEKLYS